MDMNPDKVAVILARDAIWGMPTLEWALDQFNSDKTEFILVPDRGGKNLNAVFMSTAERHYLPKCIERKFRAQTLLTQDMTQDETQPYISIYDLYHIHGMRNFVSWDHTWKKHNCAKFFDEVPNISCTLWIVDKKVLLSVRGHGAIAQAIMDGTARHEQDKRDLLSQVEKLRLQTQAIMDEIARHEQDKRDLLSQVEKLRLLAQTSDFTWEELNKATQDFSRSSVLGQGGFGCVYKGNLRGTEVAIKTLNSQSTIPLSGFKQEMAILTTVRHPNLVTLMGACYETSTLVYEFLPNGSLEKYLNPANNITPLTWQQRTRIISEICLALIFLHSNKPNMVIHGDLKPDNVLLDANFVSKLADFGISRLIKQTDTNTTQFHLTASPGGTPGYMDPDYIDTFKLTEKSDVFSFGVIILRVLTGESAMGLANRVKTAIKNNTLHEMIDVSAGEWPVDQANELAMLALKCVKRKSKKRPNLSSDVWPIVERLRRNI